MTFIKCELQGFSGHYKKNATVPATVSDLIHAAVTVGDPTMVSGPFTQRPWLEMMWRIGIVLSNLANGGSGWERSAAYRRLDPSEKSAISYFLGMVQAKLTVGSALRCTHMVHLDLLLQQQGTPLKGKRPDFIAFRSNRSSTGFRAVGTVEAKGRTNGFSFDALANAKAQAALIPRLHAHSMVRNPITVASLAYFSDTGIWESVLADPKSDGELLDLEVEDCLIEYYRPIIEAVREVWTEVWTEEGREYVAQIDGYPYEISLPVALVEAYDARQEQGRESRGVLVQTLSTLGSSTPNSDFVQVRHAPEREWASHESQVRLLGNDTATDESE